MLSIPNPRPAIENAIEYINACRATKEIKQYVVRFTKKGKTRGRPSKGEIWASKTVSAIFESDPFQKLMRKKIEQQMLYGQSTTSDQEYEKAIKEFMEAK